MADWEFQYKTQTAAGKFISTRQSTAGFKVCVEIKFNLFTPTHYKHSGCLLDYRNTRWWCLCVMSRMSQLVIILTNMPYKGLKKFTSRGGGGLDGGWNSALDLHHEVRMWCTDVSLLAAIVRSSEQLTRTKLWPQEGATYTHVVVSKGRKHQLVFFFSWIVGVVSLF